MSDTPPAGPPLGPPMVPPPVRRSPVWAMLVLTVVSVAAAVAAWLRPMPTGSTVGGPAASFSDQQVADAKAEVCAAWERVLHLVGANTSWDFGDDPIGKLVVAMDQRQTYIVGNRYLLTTLANAPATPRDLTSAITRITELFEVIMIDGLASDPSVAAHDDANSVGKEIKGLCE